MIGLAWNCRGLGRAATVRVLMDTIKSFRPDFIFLSEVKCSDPAKINLIVSSLKFPRFEFVPSVGLSGGLLLLWTSELNIQVTLSSEFAINFMVFSDPLSCAWLCSCVYGPILPHIKSLFWDGLNSIDQAHLGPWLLLGDFNSILASCEKQGGRPFASESHGGFQKVVDMNGLIDLGFIAIRLLGLTNGLGVLISKKDWIELLPMISGRFCSRMLLFSIYRQFNRITALSFCARLLSHLFPVLSSLNQCGRSMLVLKLLFGLLGARGTHYNLNSKIPRWLLSGGIGRSLAMSKPESLNSRLILQQFNLSLKLLMRSLRNTLNNGN